jgi:hypothetical protein
MRICQLLITIGRLGSARPLKSVALGPCHIRLSLYGSCGVGVCLPPTPLPTKPSANFCGLRRGSETSFCLQYPYAIIQSTIHLNHGLLTRLKPLSLDSQYL